MNQGQVFLRVIFSFQVGKETALILAIYKINIRMKHLHVDFSKYSLIMNSKQDTKKYILLIVFHIHIQCLMIIYQNKKLKDIYSATVLQEIKLNISILLIYR
jgi:hypothetical protein